MFLSSFYSENDKFVHVSPEQASCFAKKIASDFNPIHDEDAKRFCVPGDLLFALVLMKQGLFQNMHFQFTGMVGRDTALTFDQLSSDKIQLIDSKNKPYIEAHYDGISTGNMAVLEAFIRSYVSFSGHNFIHILAPLMAKHQVMINPARPLVIYESMSFSMDHLTFSSPIPKLSEATLSVDGKRGDVELYFDIFDNDKMIGNGKKTLILSGLRKYEESSMLLLTDRYNQSKAAYESALAD